MVRLRTFWLVLVLAGSAWAQRTMPLAQLEQFITSSINLKHPDKQVADTVKTIKLTQRLTASMVETWQGMGAGPRTVEALKLLVTASAALPVPPPPVRTADVITEPAPAEAELRAIIAEITQNAIDYTKGLPNFICTQVTRRYVDPYGNGGLQPADVIQEQLSFVDGKESYKVVLVNNLAVQNVSHEQLGGTTSSGEFGSTLFQLFKPETAADIRWERWGTLRGRKSYVFQFRVLQKNSEYSVYDQTSGRQGIFGYSGLIFADVETKMVMRIDMKLEGMEGFPINAVSSVLNYDMVNISGVPFVLPLKAEITSRAGRYATKNEVEFRRYSKFSADATIIFDVPDEIPPEQLEEQK